MSSCEGGILFKKLNKNDLACNDFKTSADLGYSLAKKELINFCESGNMKRKE